MNTAVAVTASRYPATRGLAHFDSLPVNNLATRSWVSTIAMEDFARMAEIANEARVGPDLRTQRDLYPEHAFKIAKYILKSMVASALSAAEKDPNIEPEVLESLGQMRAELGDQPCFALQPFVVSIRAQDRNELNAYKEGAFEILQISNKAKLWVIDGQHRVHAIRAVSDFLRSVHDHNHYPAIRIGETFNGYLYGAPDQLRTAAEGQAWRVVQWLFSRCDVSANIFTELDIPQERQMFHDLNNLGRSVEAGIAFHFDMANPINKWIKQELIPKVLKSNRVVDRDQKNWDDDQGHFVRKDLVAVNAFLFLRRTSVNTAEPRHVNPASTKVALRFWSQILAVPHMGQPGAKKNVILAQPVVQKALALLVNQFGMPRNRKSKSSAAPRDPEVADQILDAIPKIDWSHSNPVWRAWTEGGKDTKLRGIKPYLPKDIAKAKGEFATLDSDRIRFGIKHNEIAPALANLIRYQLKLDPKKSRK